MTDVVGNPEEERRAEFYHEPWSQEAVSRYFYCKVWKKHPHCWVTNASPATEQFNLLNCTVCLFLSDPAAPTGIGTIFGSAKHISIAHKIPLASWPPNQWTSQCYSAHCYTWTCFLTGWERAVNTPVRTPALEWPLKILLKTGVSNHSKPETTPYKCQCERRLKVHSSTHIVKF